MHTLGVTNFAFAHSTRDMGQSYSTLEWDEVIELVLKNWDKAKPGSGESDCSRKVLVPVPSEGFFCPVKAKIVMGMPVHAEVTRRQEHEDPFVDKFVMMQDAIDHDALIDEPAKTVDVVCFSRESLSENDEKPSTDCDWEIVTILATAQDKQEPMAPLVMARNYLEKPGGTFTDYSAKAFAESIWFHSTKGTIRVKP